MLTGARRRRAGGGGRRDRVRWAAGPKFTRPTCSAQAQPERLAAATEQRVRRGSIFWSTTPARRGAAISSSSATPTGSRASGSKFFAQVKLCRAVWPMLKARGGSVVAIAGIGGRAPVADYMIGSSVIGAQLAFMKALADVGKRDGVQVNSVNPGSVDTDRFRHRLGIIMKRDRPRRDRGRRASPQGTRHHPLRQARRRRRPRRLHRRRRAGAGCMARQSTWTAGRSTRCGCRNTTDDRVAQRILRTLLGPAPRPNDLSAQRKGALRGAPLECLRRRLSGRKRRRSRTSSTSRTRPDAGCARSGSPRSSSGRCSCR